MNYIFRRKILLIGKRLQHYRLRNFISDCMFLLTVSCIKSSRKSFDPPKWFSLPCMQRDLRFGGPALQSFRDFFDVKARLLVQKNFYFCR